MVAILDKDFDQLWDNLSEDMGESGGDACYAVARIANCPECGTVHTLTGVCGYCGNHCNE